jgi:hypothetical protein
VTNLPLCLIAVAASVATVLLYAYTVRMILAAERHDDWED